MDDAVQEYSRRLVEAGLGRHEPALVGLARAGVRIESYPLGTGQRAGSRSRLGGDPDLPDDVVWPTFGGVPQSFIAQIDLADVHPLIPGVLPEAGLLSFFYDSAQSVWGFDPADAAACRVVRFPPDAELHSRRSPVDHPRYVRFEARSLRFERDVTFCPYESFELELLDLSRDELAAYADVLGDALLGGHRLLGHASSIQGDMQLECQLVSNGLNCGDGSGYRDARAEALRPGAADWRLLLQVDTDDAARMMWGDCGMLYWWMRDDDIRNARWDRAHLILQCC